MIISRQLSLICDLSTKMQLQRFVTNIIYEACFFYFFMSFVYSWFLFHYTSLIVEQKFSLMLCLINCWHISSFQFYSYATWLFVASWSWWVRHYVLIIVKVWKQLRNFLISCLHYQHNLGKVGITKNKKPVM